jgi:tRNA pseudouridine13 synthase
MKLKQLPDDFQVEELTDVQPSTQGSFALYRLEKRGWTTPDALQTIRRRWQIDLRRISCGGLKDRHAHTVQYITIFNGPQRRLTQSGITLQYLGKVAEPYSSQHIRANRFRLTLRSLDDARIRCAEQALIEVGQDGVPNYFDDQRFGSVCGGEFMAKALVQGEFEKALRLALAAPYEYDRAAQKKEKAILKAHWGDWPVCQQKLPRGPTRYLVDYLAHGGDFASAIARLRPELRGLYLSAYQSHLWNNMLARWLRGQLRPEQLIPVTLRLGEMPMHRRLDDDQRALLAGLELPLPTARGTLEHDESAAALMNTVLAEEGLTREQLKVRGLRQVFFSRGNRAALFVTSQLEFEAGDDERNQGMRKLQLACTLPRGCYATLLVKRITSF